MDPRFWGEGRGERKEGLRSSALARAVEQENEEFLKSFSFKALIELCTNLQKTGCVLAWLLINFDVHQEECKHLKTFLTIFQRNVWPRAVRRRSALPMRRGILEETVYFLRTHTLRACLETGSVERLAKDCWCLMACYACNTLVGLQQLPAEGNWTRDETVAGAAVASAVDRLLSHGLDIELTADAIEKDLKLTRVSYSGEEVGTCHTITLRQVEPALPPEGHGGCTDLMDYVTPFTRKLLANPELCIHEDKGQKLPKLQGKIHMAPNERERIADLLVQRGVCSWVPLREVLHFREQPVLNGMFGVEKPSKISTGEPILRLIMNLVPSNSVMIQMEGGTTHLPSITSWMSIVGTESEQVKVWQSDMSNAFYLFRLPTCWQRCLCFNIIRTGASLGKQDNVDYALACSVLPMGWLSSVAIMQEVSERLLLEEALESASQLQRNKPIPVWMTGLLKDARRDGRCWWHVYLDNFCAGQILEANEFTSGGDEMHWRAEEAWRNAKVMSSDKKRISGALRTEELGALIDGDSMVIGGSAQRFLKLILATLWVLGREHLSKKHVQIIAGRWVHVLQFRRPGMSFLEYTWEYVGTKRFSSELVLKVRRELFSLLAAVPLLHTNLRATLPDFITASDASMTGGAILENPSITQMVANALSITLNRFPRPYPVFTAIWFFTVPVAGFHGVLALLCEHHRVKGGTRGERNVKRIFFIFSRKMYACWAHHARQWWIWAQSVFILNTCKLYIYNHI